MRSIFRYVKGSWKAICVILALLVVQAYCDLSLPTYTSSIVDVGIQQNGIADAAALQLQDSTMQKLQMFMTEEETGQINTAYERQDDIYILRSNLTDEEIQQVSDTMLAPMALLAQLSQGNMGGTYSMEELQYAYANGMIGKEQLAKMRDQAMTYLDAMSETTRQQMAATVIAQEYEATGLDIGRLRNRYLLTTGGKMLGLAAISVFASIIIGLLAARTGSGVGKMLRERVFGKVLSFSSAEMNKFSTASLITRCTNDIQQVQMTTVIILRMVLYAPICAIGGILKVLNTKTGMEWIIIVAVLIIMSVLGTLVSIAMPKFRMMQTLIDRMNLISREILTGIMPIRAFSRERHEEERFEGANTALMRTQLFTNRVMTFLMPTMMLVMNGISVAIVWFGAKGIDAGKMQVGDLMAFINYTMMIVMSFMMLTMLSIMLPRAAVAANRIEEVCATKLTIFDKEEPVHHPNGWQGRVAFEDVSFCYPGASDEALSHISFTAEPGKTTAIIGSTGCGKSTLLNLIPRFYDVTSGRVTIDDVDIRDIDRKELRDQLGYVPQKGILFSGDIESNLKFAGNVSDEHMKLAAEIAQASAFIGEKTDGYHSHIAQGGSNVSGGQKQRLSIARAIAKQPKVFLFDDSFSALDYKTDAALRRALAQNIGEATVIIVAQRISTILHADQIIVLNEGKIDGIGTHEQLLQTCATYREIAESQLSEAELKGGVSE